MSGAMKHKDRSHRSHKTNLSNLQWFWRGAGLKQQVKIQSAEARKSWINRFLDMLKDEKSDSEVAEET